MSDQTVDRIEPDPWPSVAPAAPTRRTTVTRRRRTRSRSAFGPVGRLRRIIRAPAGQAWSRASAPSFWALPWPGFACWRSGRSPTRPPSGRGRRPRRRGRLRHHPGDQRRPEGAAPRRQRASAVASTLSVHRPVRRRHGGSGYFVYYDARSWRVHDRRAREPRRRPRTKPVHRPGDGRAAAVRDRRHRGLWVCRGPWMIWQRALDRFGRFSLARDLKPAEHVADVASRSPTHLRRGGPRFRFDQLSLDRVDVSCPADSFPMSVRSCATPTWLGMSAGDRRAVQRPDRRRHRRRGSSRWGRARHWSRARASWSSATSASTPRRSSTRPTSSYRGTDMYAMAPSSSGGSTVGESLNILGNFDLSRETRVGATRYESTRLAFADRKIRYVGDPRFVNVPLVPATVQAVRRAAAVSIPRTR